jgi:uncharacterized protein
MKRTLIPYIQKDLPDKIVLITGPRQAGKTTLSRLLCEAYGYLNYDAMTDRVAIKKQQWDRRLSLVIFDELHKMRFWKAWLKGVYDTEGMPPAIVVTGSAKLDTYKKVGDSLAGRFFQYRLHPLDVKEATQMLGVSSEDSFERLMTVGGFPEPFLKNEVRFYRRWQQTHLDIILKQDLIETGSVRDIIAIETLILLLRSRVGSTISYASLARDLERDQTTVKRWLQLLENMYVIFPVLPYSKRISKSLLKAPKYYFYDTAFLDGDNGSRLENIVACALRKELDFINDVAGVRGQLCFLRTRDGRELDFVVVQDSSPTHVIEVKWADTTISRSFGQFASFLPPTVQKIQLVKEIPRVFSTKEGVRCESVVSWLADLSLCDDLV